MEHESRSGMLLADETGALSLHEIAELERELEKRESNLLKMRAIYSRMHIAEMSFRNDQCHLPPCPSKSCFWSI
jgi:hypothetical protein